MKPRLVARVYRGTARNIAFLAGRLRAGEVVAVPSETVYGLAANALDAKACAKIFAAKNRPADDPLIVHLHSVRQLDTICEPNLAARKLARKFWPGPLTLVLPKKPAIPKIVTAGRASVAVRMPSHPLFRRLLRASGFPLAAPSANPFGYLSPTTVAHVQQGLGHKIRYILEGGPSQVGVESTIVDLRNPERPAILRPGCITAAQIERVLRRKMQKTSARDPGRGLLAPGLLARHYSPRTPLVLHKKLPPPARSDTRQAFVFLRKPPGNAGAGVYWLDEHGKLRGAARRLFARLRQLDAMGFDAIHIELVPSGGLGDAINDRLRRAAAR